jgi:hypothetical protein
MSTTCDWPKAAARAMTTRCRRLDPARAAEPDARVPPPDISETDTRSIRQSRPVLGPASSAPSASTYRPPPDPPHLPSHPVNRATAGRLGPGRRRRERIGPAVFISAQRRRTTPTYRRAPAVHRYLMGIHVIAEQMYRHGPATMLYASLHRDLPQSIRQRAVHRRPAQHLLLKLRPPTSLAVSQLRHCDSDLENSERITR